MRAILRPRTLLVVLLLLLVAAAWLAYGALQVRQSLESARTDLRAVRDALQERDLPAARAAAAGAAAKTQEARDSTSDPVWRVAGAVPLLGRTFATTSGVAAVADRLSSEVLTGLLDAVEVVDPDALRRSDGTIDLAPVAAAQPPLRTSLERATAAQQELADLPTTLIPGAVRAAHAELAGETADLIDLLDGVSTATEIAPLLLGQDEPRRYFVMIQQNAESRGTGGLTGGYVILEADGGRLDVTDQGSNADLRNEVIPPPAGVPADYVQHYTGFGAFGLWQNINVSPNLPVVARVVADRWRRQSGQRIDGVIAVDAQGLQFLLRGAGSIPLPGGGSLAPDGIVDYLAVGQYRDFAPPQGSTGIDQSPERKQVLERISRAATQRLVTGGGDSEQLLRGLVEAVRSGHLRMTSADGQLGPLLRGAGVDGALPEGEAPVAYPVVFNSTGGKLDHWLQRSVTYTAGPCQGPRRRSTITVELRNDAPATGLPRYLTNRIDGNGQTSSLVNAVTLQVYGTRGALLESASLDGAPLSGVVRVNGQFLSETSEAGLPLWHLRLELPRGQTRRLQLRLVEPVVPGEARVPEQPLSRSLQRQVDVPAC